jgi:MscS family membrane protein
MINKTIPTQKLPFVLHPKGLTVIFLFVFFQIGVAQETVNLSSPRATMKTFLQSMKKVKQGQDSAYQTALKTLDLSLFDPATAQTSGQLAADRLIKTIDRIRYVNYQEIPSHPQGDKWIFEREELATEDDLVTVEIAMTKSKNQRWKFSQDTIKNIHLYEHLTRSRGMVKGAKELTNWKEQLKGLMPNWMGKNSFILYNGQWIGLLIIIFLALMAKKLVNHFVSNFIQKKFEKIDYRQVTQKTKKRFSVATGLIVYSVVWILGVGLLEFEDGTLSVLHRGGLIVFALSLVWAAHHLVDIVASYFEQIAKNTENKFDDLLVPLMRKSAKVFTICIGVIYIAHSLTINVTNLLAGLGIGGLAFALAAKDTLSNLFGSLTVILDRPFQIGDWVTIGDSIEGIVEEVGFRSTRIRTFYTSLITLPNNQLTNTHIDNYGKRSFRRYTTTLGVQYDTPPKKIEAFCEGIRQLIISSPATRKDYFNVYLKGFGASSIDIHIYMFWDVPDYVTELSVKHRFLLDILRLAHQLKISFAFPTQTVHLFNEQAVQHQEMGENFHEVGATSAEKLYHQNLAHTGPRSAIDQFRPSQAPR